MSSPIVYLGNEHTGKELFNMVCLSNNLKTSYLREDIHVTIYNPKSETEYSAVRYSYKGGELSEDIILSRSPKLEYEYFDRKNLIDSRVKPEKDPSYIEGYISNNQAYSILSKHTDSFSWIISPKIEDTFEFFCKPLFYRCKFLIPYRRRGILKQIVNFLGEDINTTIDKYFIQYERLINTLRDLNHSYDYFDMSDRNAYRNLGLNENLKYNYDTYTFISGDPAFENQYDKNEKAKLIVDRANQYIDDRRDYLTSLFPDIVL